VVVGSLVIAVLSLSIVTKLKRFRGTGNRWVIRVINCTWWVFWGVAGAMFDGLRGIFAIANEIPVESVVIISGTLFAFMGMTVYLLKKAEDTANIGISRSK
jgi:hypothetical protein